MGSDPDMANKQSKSWMSWVLVSIVSGMGLSSFTGCQTTVAGQTHPSAYYLYDDVQYFPAGPENKLAAEMAKQKEDKARAKQQGRR